MSSIIKVNTFQDANGNALFSSDGSGNVTTSASGLQMTPTFEATRTSDQSITDVTVTKVEYNIENFDTDNYYDNSTNYRFTPLVSGKYYVYASIQAEALGDSDLRRTAIYIYKNGSVSREIQWLQNTYRARQQNPYIAGIIDMNGTTDYLEIYAYIDDNSGNPVINANSNQQNYFGAYKIIGA